MSGPVTAAQRPRGERLTTVLESTSHISTLPEPPAQRDREHPVLTMKTSHMKVLQ